MRSKQFSFLPPLKLCYGGDDSAGRRKCARPFDPKRRLHVTMRSLRARGTWSMLHPKHRDPIECLIHRIAKRNEIRIYRLANVGNHLHFLLKAPTRRKMHGFFREPAGRIALLVTQARKGQPLGKFWEKLLWSRVVSWGRDFKGAMAYLTKNLLEAEWLPRDGRKGRARPPSPAPD